MSVPFEICGVEGELHQKLLKDFQGERTGFVQVGSKRWFLPEKYREQAAGIYNMELRSDDVWISTFPRTGTTWTQELMWIVANDLNFEEASRKTLGERFPFVDGSFISNDEFYKELEEMNRDNPDALQLLSSMNTIRYESISKMPSPRFIKTHLPFELLPPKLLDTCKVVYVARNPRDTAVSCFHHNRLVNAIGYTGDFHTYWDYFEKGLVQYAPYWEHIVQGWAKTNHPNLLFLFYEDMKQDLSQAIKKVAKFLNKVYNDEEVSRLVKHLDFSNFRDKANLFPKVDIKGFANEEAQPFLRKGITGGWKEEFNDELSARADKWIEDNYKFTDLRFPE